VDHWCRACGHDVDGAPSTCPSCDAPLTPPEPGPTRVGRVVVLGRALRRRQAVAVADTGGFIRLAVKPDSMREITTAEFDDLPVVPLPGPVPFGAAGRLWSAAAGRHREPLDGRWSSEELTERARTVAVTDLGTRRAAALDAVVLGVEHELDRLDLTAAEIGWYRARAAAAARDADALLTHLETLPPKGYRERVPLLLRCVDLLVDDPGRSERARSVLEPFSTDLQAAALRAALSTEPGKGEYDVLQGYADLLSGLVEIDFRPVAQVLQDGGRLPALPPVASHALLAFDANQAGLDGWSLDAADVGDALDLMPGPALEALIEAGAVGRAPQGLGPGRSFLRCRLDPGSASDEELQATGHIAEQARRALRSGDRDTLVALPDDDAAVRHYRGLLAWRDGAPIDLDALRPDVIELLGQAETAASVGGEVPAAVASDPTLWPRLVGGDASLRALGSGTGPAASLGAWLGLLAVQSATLAGRWDDVLSLAEPVRREVTHPRIRDEVRNQVALAHWNLGDSRAALALLDEALAEGPRVELLVNAALVAAERDWSAAVPYLERLHQSGADADVRAAAVRWAIQLWCSAPDPDYPARLRDLVRAALQEPQDAGFFHEVVGFASRRDAGWLSGAALPTPSGEEGYLAYEKVRGAAMLPGRDETLADAIRVLGGIHRASEVPDWAREEGQSLVREAVDLVHREFGTAAGLLSTVEALVDEGLAGTADRIELSVQMGAHVACALDDDGECVSTTFEDRFLFGPAAERDRVDGDLTDAERAYLDEEITRCLVVAAQALFSHAARCEEKWVTDWNSALQQGQPFVTRSRILDQLAVWPPRLRRYADVLSRRDLDEKRAPTLAALTATAQGMSDEIARLRRT
jgi:hypothetical protein